MLALWAFNFNETEWSTHPIQYVALEPLITLVQTLLDGLIALRE